MFNDLLWTDLKDIIIFLLILMKPLKYKKNIDSYIDGNMAQ